MGGTADAAFHPAYAENHFFQGTFKGTEVITMSDQACGMSTGAGEAVKVE